MAELKYCKLKIFGSEFDAYGFSSHPDTPKGEIVHSRSDLPDLRSPIRAIQLGKVISWQTEKNFYSTANIKSFNVFHEFLYEEEFLKNFMEDCTYLLKILEYYKNDSTEVWLTVIYSSSRNDPPRGIFFSKNFIDSLSQFGCSISTDIDYID